MAREGGHIPPGSLAASASASAAATNRSIRRPSNSTLESASSKPALDFLINSGSIASIASGDRASVTSGGYEPMAGNESVLSSGSQNALSTTSSATGGASHAITFSQEGSSNGPARAPSLRYFDKSNARPWRPKLHQISSQGSDSSSRVSSNSASTGCTNNVAERVSISSGRSAGQRSTARSVTQPGCQPGSLGGNPSGSIAETASVVRSVTQQVTAGAAVTAAVTATSVAVVAGTTSGTGTDIESKSSILSFNPDNHGLYSLIIGGDITKHNLWSSKLQSALSSDASLDPFSVSAPLSYYSHVPRIFGAEPPQIAGQASVLKGDMMILFGGRTPYGVTNDLYMFSCTSHLLTKAKYRGGYQPPALTDVSAVLIGNWIYFFGGQDGHGVCSDQLFALNTKTLEFIHPEVMNAGTSASPCARRGHSAIHYNGKKLVIFGGINDEMKFLNDIWEFDITTMVWTLLEPVKEPEQPLFAPEPRAYHISHLFVKNGRPNIIVHGGNDEDNVFDGIWHFDLEEKNWNYISTDKPIANKRSLHGLDDVTNLEQPFARTLHTSDFTANNFLVLVGGFDGKDFVDTTYVYDIAGGKWVIRVSYGIKRVATTYHAMEFYESRFYICGGFDLSRLVAGFRIIELPISSVRIRDVEESCNSI